MATNYQSIRQNNLKKYGTDIGRIGKELLADRYDDRTHFIFELLQNVEDALSRRGDNWKGSRTVEFALEPDRLVLSHFGHPFNKKDVLGICGILESTKNKSSIGRFGIGFKSVYTFTDRPEIHSGDESFAIENYVQPVYVDQADKKPDETLIILPLKSKDSTAKDEIISGFRRLGPNVLLFLQHIEEIKWSVENDISGFYSRGKPDFLSDNTYRITVIGQVSGEQEVDQDWLVFNRNVSSSKRKLDGQVEIAFSLVPTKESSDKLTVISVTDQPLVVFFPTIVSTNLGFLVQGPYHTTPSRDNIYRDDNWNQYLIQETATLLIEAMRWFRDRTMLDTSVLNCLPLNKNKFSDNSIFAPLFDAVRDAFISEPLLPCFEDGYLTAREAKLARTQDMRDLFTSDQISQIYDVEDAAWLASEITLERTPEICQYLSQEFKISGETPKMIISHLNLRFLERQSDEWIRRLYEFLNGKSALRSDLNTIPLIRLSDKTHVVALDDEKPVVFLPGPVETDFPTIYRNVCSSEKALDFLKSLGITEPNLVDDVVWNVLKKYKQEEVNIDDKQYAIDINRIRVAFQTDSKAQKEKLLSELRDTPFVKTYDASDISNVCISKPSNIYLATDRLKQLFAGVPEIFIVNDKYDCLRGEDMRELLIACGASRYLRPIKINVTLTTENCTDLRKKAGQTSGHDVETFAWSIQGFDYLIKRTLPMLSVEDRFLRASLIWESLDDLETRSGRNSFEGTYKWRHYSSEYTARFPSTFVQLLNNTSWIPNSNGELQHPSSILFGVLGWSNNPFLLDMIQFKPPIITRLAEEAGFDPAILDLLKRHDITSVEKLKLLLPVETEGIPTTAISNELSHDEASNNSSSVSTFPETQGDVRRDRQHHTDTEGFIGGNERVSRSTQRNLGENASSQYNAKYEFVSYIAMHFDRDKSDPDNLSQAARMNLEKQAIELIIEREPMLNSTPPGNAGFDLYEIDDNGDAIRWVEVKAMTSNLKVRPVGITKTQFEYARKYGAAYWLYIVEDVNDLEKFRIVKIQDPFGHAETFTFDYGWIEIAQKEPSD